MSLHKTYARSMVKLMPESLREPSKRRGWDKPFYIASHFVAGLRPLQSRVVGMEGGMDQLVLKARFEEAKSKELAAARSGPATKSNKGDANGGTCFGASRKGDRGSSRQDKSTQQEDVTDKCFNCGMEGHYVGIVLTPNRKRKMCRRGGRRSPP